VNIFRLYKIYKKASKLLSLFSEATASYERAGNMITKSLFLSKTFWFNIVTVCIELSGVLPIPPGVAGIVVGIGNIALRTLTNQSVHVLSD
tara:strand:+ start:308 stop:580 length:273 start_codon:yes stop_codon:yes gene_type:complete